MLKNKTYLTLKRLFSGYRARRIANIISGLIHNGERVLDFGCGKFMVAEFIKKKADVEIVGLDVIDQRLVDLPFVLYDGKNIPFTDKDFDVTYASFVFHHTENIVHLLQECIRVTKKRIVILEDVYENRFELQITKLLDYIGNRFSSLSIDIPLNFKKKSEWLDLFKRLGVDGVKSKEIKLYKFRPTRHELFILDLESKTL